jgi:hypothetical protein
LHEQLAAVDRAAIGKVGSHEAGGFWKGTTLLTVVRATWQVRHERVDTNPQETLFSAC